MSKENTGKQDDAVVLSGRWVETVELREGGAVRLRKCRVKDIKLVTTFIATVAAQLKLDTTGNIGVALNDANTILQLVSTGTEQVFAVCSALTDKTQEELEDLDLDEGLKVVMKAYELNKSFFMQQVKPQIDPLLQQLRPKQNEPQKKLTTGAG